MQVMLIGLYVSRVAACREKAQILLKILNINFILQYIYDMFAN